MATTANYVFNLPTVGGDDAVWGGLLNDNWTDLDADLTTIQNDIDSRILTSGIGSAVQAWDANLDQIAAIVPTNNNFLVGNGSSWVKETPANVRSSLDLEVGVDVQIFNATYLLDADIGGSLQAWDANLDQIAALAPTNNNFIVGNGSSWALETPANVRSSLALVIGTNVQAQNARLDTLSGVSAANATAVGNLTGTNAGDEPTATTSAEGVVRRSTSAQNVTGTIDTRYPTVAGTKEMIDTHAVSGFEFISSDNLGGAVADFTGFDASKYDAYLFIFQNVIPVTDGQSLAMRTSSNGGGAYDTSGYQWSYTGSKANGTSVSGNGEGASAIALTGAIGSASNEDGTSGIVDLPGPHLTKRTQVVWNMTYEDNGGDFAAETGSGQRLSSALVDAVRFYFPSGNLESGTITMYGRRNA